MKNLKIIFRIIVGLIVCINTNVFCQQNKIDSLQSLLKKDKQDTNKVIHLFLLCGNYADIGLYDTALYYGNSALKLSETLNFKYGIASSYSNIGRIYYLRSNYPKTLENWLQALKIDEEIKNKKGIAMHTGNIGAVYYSQKDFSKAMSYFSKALNMDEQLKDKKAIAADIGSIGCVFLDEREYSKALEYYFRALKLAKELKDKYLIGVNLGNIGDLFFKQKDYSQSLNYYFQALKVSEEIGDKNITALNLGNIGTIYMNIGKFKEAEQYLKKSISLNDSIGSLNGLMEKEESISKLYDTIGQYKLALFHYKKSIAIRDTIYSQENTKLLVRKEMNYEFDKKEAITKAIAEEKSQKQEIITYSVIGGLLLVLVFAGFIFRSLRITKRQKIVIENQKQIVEEHQKEIIASINYAKRLQDAILPPIASIKKHFPESFVLYLPKDVVAGDFYWMETIDNITFIAAADSTGHGVPGAMMSVVCSNALNRAVKEFGLRDTGIILDKVTDLVLETFEKSGTDVKDGMDISILAINKINNTIQWSGANNPLWYTQNDKIIEIKPDKQPIGQCDNRKSFTTHHINSENNSLFYLFTDGYADQFGGIKGKKFMYKKFQENLLTIHNLPLEQQENALKTEFEAWKGSLEQVDDVTVIGIRA